MEIRLNDIKKCLGNKRYEEYEYLIVDSDFCMKAPMEEVIKKLPKLIKAYEKDDNFDEWYMEERKWK